MVNTGVLVLALLSIAHVVSAHSILTTPQCISSQACRLGGGLKCAGPCDFTMIEGRAPGKEWARFFPPDKPAATYQRGQKVEMTYTRNNHNAGGFLRLTLVPLDKMKDKAVHSRNAFHYSCWGAQPVVATGSDLDGPDKYNFDMIGSDGAQHPYPKGYYKFNTEIPNVVPDGQYILGWTWFGGTSSEIKGNVPQQPGEYSFFSDYWSCAFVVVQGGSPLASSYTPKFVNDMSQFSTEGCMSFTDKMGDCPVEPCTGIKAKYRKPAKFLQDPKPLTPADFGGSAVDPPPAAESPSPSPAPSSPVPDAPAPESPSPSPSTPAVEPPNSKPPSGSPNDPELPDKGLMSCLCLSVSGGCSPTLASYTNDCKAYTGYTSQGGACVSTCCDLCKATGTKYAACRDRHAKRVCNL